MIHQYPRFLYSNQENNTIEGPFLVHLLHPNKLYRIEWDTKYPDYTIHRIPDWGDDCTEYHYTENEKDAVEWLNDKIAQRAIIWGN